MHPPPAGFLSAERNPERMLYICKLVFVVVFFYFTWRYLNVVAICSVTICSIRQILIIRHFRCEIHKVVCWVTHCPSPAKWRHITIGPEHVGRAIRLHQVHSIWSIRECCLAILAALSFIKLKMTEAHDVLGKLIPKPHSAPANSASHSDPKLNWKYLALSLLPLRWCRSYVTMLRFISIISPDCESVLFYIVCVVLKKCQWYYTLLLIIPSGFDTKGSFRGFKFKVAKRTGGGVALIHPITNTGGKLWHPQGRSYCPGQVPNRIGTWNVRSLGERESSENTRTHEGFLRDFFVV